MSSYLANRILELSAQARRLEQLHEDNVTERITICKNLPDNTRLGSYRRKDGSIVELQIVHGDKTELREGCGCTYASVLRIQDGVQPPAPTQVDAAGYELRRLELENGEIEHDRLEVRNQLLEVLHELGLDYGIRREW